MQECIRRFKSSSLRQTKNTLDGCFFVCAKRRVCETNDFSEVHARTVRTLIQPFNLLSAVRRFVALQQNIFSAPNKTAFPLGKAVLFCLSVLEEDSFISTRQKSPHEGFCVLWWSECKVSSTV